MTVTVAGHWEQGYLAPLTEAPMWAWPLRDFGISDWRMWPVSGIECPDRAVSLTEAADLRALLSGCPDAPRVFIEPRNQMFAATMSSDWMHEFEHPRSAIYVFGSAHFNPVATDLYRPDQDSVVSIKTTRDNGVLFAHQALVVTLVSREKTIWP